MPATDADFNLSGLFFSPLALAMDGANPIRKRSVISLRDWLAGGVSRSLSTAQSGRDYLQTIAPDHLEEPWKRSSYFDSLKSKKRLGELREIADLLSQEVMPMMVPDRLSCLPELDGFDVFAEDGHWHLHATHDPKRISIRIEDREVRTMERHFATGHLYGLNLRTRALTHLTHCDEETKRKENDMGALKRLDPSVLRQGAGKGKKVLWIWDKAAISYEQWYKWKQRSGVYFVSQAKENMNLNATQNPIDRSHSMNEGVLQDGFLVDGPQTLIRLVVFEDPFSGKIFRFITNLMNVQPGTIAQLYRMRWDIEKSFDGLKNQLQETKAWATGSISKSMQAIFLTITMNLITISNFVIAFAIPPRERERPSGCARNEKSCERKARSSPASMADS